MWWRGNIKKLMKQREKTTGNVEHFPVNIMSNVGLKQCFNIFSIFFSTAFASNTNQPSKFILTYSLEKCMSHSIKQKVFFGQFTSIFFPRNTDSVPENNILL